jgi:hypothetical protein
VCPTILYTIAIDSVYLHSQWLEFSTVLRAEAHQCLVIVEDTWDTRRGRGGGSRGPGLLPENESLVP